MNELEEPVPPPCPRRKSFERRLVHFLVNSLHGLGAIAAAFLTAAFLALNLLKVINVVDDTSRWLFFGLMLIFAITFAALYTFGIGAVIDRIGFLLSRRLRKRNTLT
jgi:glucan phosphoethanolaminetransferase (alkaline phosphatase superfamily)